MDSDNLMGLAGQMSYYFSLALFPFLIFLAAVAGSLPVTGLWVRILKWMIFSLPMESRSFMLTTVMGLTRGHRSFLSYGMLGTLGATQTFNLYVGYVASYDKTYGALGAFLILMVWIYLLSLITLIGAEINAEMWKMKSHSGEI